MNQPKTRSKIALDAWFQTGAGKHGGSKKRRNKRDRKKAKQELR